MKNTSMAISRLNQIMAEKLGDIEKKYENTIPAWIRSGKGTLRPEPEIRELYANRPDKADSKIGMERVFDFAQLKADRDANKEANKLLIAADVKKVKETAEAVKTAIIMEDDAIAQQKFNDFKAMVV